MGIVGNNSFVNILEPDTDENDDLNKPYIIQHSSYHDHDKLLSNLNEKKIISSHLVQIFNPSMQKSMNLTLLLKILKK